MPASQTVYWETEAGLDRWRPNALACRSSGWCGARRHGMHLSLRCLGRWFEEGDAGKDGIEMIDSVAASLREVRSPLKTASIGTAHSNAFDPYMEVLVPDESWMAWWSELPVLSAAGREIGDC